MKSEKMSRHRTDDPIEELLSVKGTRLILLYLYDHPGCTRSDVRNELFGGRRKNKAFNTVIGCGLVGTNDKGTLWLTSTGKWVAGTFAEMKAAVGSYDDDLCEDEGESEFEDPADGYQPFQYEI